MESAILLILSSIIILLQIIILINQSNNKKLLLEQIAAKGSFREKRSDKETENKNENKNQVNAVSSAITSPAKSEDIEKSLRNINLKLKNAERDQEVARKRVLENINGNLIKEKHHNNDNFQHGRDRNKKGFHNKKNRKDNRNRNFVASHQGGDHHSQEQAIFHNERIENKDITAPQNVKTFEELKPVDFSVDNTEHGRKFIVKRRPLKDEVEITSEVEAINEIKEEKNLLSEENKQPESVKEATNNTNTSSVSVEAPSEQKKEKDDNITLSNSDNSEVQPQDNLSQNTEISFGRR